jgi:hypothetical protein
VLCDDSGAGVSVRRAGSSRLDATVLGAGSKGMVRIVGSIDEKHSFDAPSRLVDHGEWQSPPKPTISPGSRGDDNGVLAVEQLE